jgi:CRAL/TRIO domain
MWCYEKSKIEAQWNPKKPEPGLEQPLNKQALNDETSSQTPTTTTNSDSCVEEPQQQQPAKKPHRLALLSRPKLRGLLAALSFEDHPKPFRRKKTKAARAAKSAAEGNIAEQQRPPLTRASSSFVHRGTRIDSDESDVFFDAEQFGDLTTDSFGPRESVVLAGIKISSLLQDHVSSIETEYLAVGAMETKELEETNVDCDDSDEEFEYSEHDYHEHNGSGAGTIPRTISNDPRTRSHLTLELIPEAVVTSTPPPPPMQSPPPPPPPPTELPLRFLRAGKNDKAEGLRRYEATLAMRKQERLDTILREASPDFATIKKYYPHYFVGKGKNGEPCFYEQPPKTNLKALRAAGVTLDKLLRHYTMVTEFQWQYLERDDLATSIYIIDLDGIRMADFVGEAVDFVKKAAAFSAQHYPERAGYVYVINVPAWFQLIWRVITPIIDADTLKKIYILRGKDEICKAFQERIPVENIPINFGGTAVPLGESPAEQELAALVSHNNTLAEQGWTVCPHDCRFCKWVPARSY